MIVGQKARASAGATEMTRTCFNHPTKLFVLITALLLSTESANFAQVSKFAALLR
jgi:hypothetical protein